MRIAQSNVSALSNLTVATLLALENVRFDDVVKAMPGITATGSSIKHVDHLLTSSPTYALSVLETDRYVFVGGLSSDMDGSTANPLESCDANGKIVHHGRRGNREENAEFYEALGFTSDGEKALDEDEVKKELASWVTTWLRQQKSMMASFSAQRRLNGGYSGKWDDVLKFVFDCIVEGGHDYAMDVIAERLFDTSYWNRLDDEIREKFDDLYLLNWASQAEEAWERCVEKGVIGNPHAVKLDIYEHSGVAYSLSGEGYFCRWDTSRCAALWIPDAGALENIKESTWTLFGVSIKYKGASGSTTDPLHVLITYPDGTQATFASYAAALAHLDQNPLKSVDPAEFRKAFDKKLTDYARSNVESYSQWANGEVYSMHVHVIDKLSDTELDQSTQIVGGFIGHDSAEEEMQATLLNTVATTCKLH